MKRVLITGASGLLGLNVALTAAQSGYHVTGWSGRRALVQTPFATEQMDLTELEGLPARIAALAPDVIIHCAALADIDRAEQHPGLAEKLNAQVPSMIAQAAKACGAQLVHISTDAVFDGTRGDYRETDAPNPINTYARTKLAGEAAVAAAYPQALVARVNFYGWSASGQRSLAEFFYTHLRAEQTVSGFTDVYFSPLYSRHLAQLLLLMVEKGLSGLYHVFSPQATSKYAFGVSLARQFELDESLINPVSFADAGLSTPRPLNLSMNTDKLQAELDAPLPSEQAGLQALYEDALAGLPDKLVAYLA
ncbi:MAG: Putative dTDP-4-dehydrorhamnose reductase [Anaerolineae bacterium 49_20]|nr:MAG: Putative dTDP-4-dehydrorhamnose reductase [Anaerolineae bacterium 49_20]